MREWLRKKLTIKDSCEDNAPGKMSIMDTYLSVIDLANHSEVDIGNAISKAIRDVAMDYIEKDPGLGYLMLADWNQLLVNNCGQALLMYMNAADYGVEEAIKAINSYREKAEEGDAYICALFAEAYMLKGATVQGKKWMERSKELGSDLGAHGLNIIQGGNIRIISEIHDFSLIGVFSSRLSREIIVDFRNLKKKDYKKFESFLKGYAAGKCANLSIDTDFKKAVLSHTYNERVLKEITKEENMETVRLNIASKEELFNSLDIFLHGSIVKVDTSRVNNKTSLMEIIPYWLDGLTLALNGESSHNDKFLIINPGLKES